ncbi:MAG: hypothetical protein KKD31_12825 [Bacteroidetes bacterium]|nr:hypothetical protein [Bacteroidota bacterium]
MLKADELFGGGGFLSGLGFKQEEKKQEPEEETAVTTSDIFEKSSETIPTQQTKSSKTPFGKPTFSFDVQQPKKVEIKSYPSRDTRPAARPQQRRAYVPPKAAPIHGGHQKPQGYRG